MANNYHTVNSNAYMWVKPIKQAQVTHIFLEFLEIVFLYQWAAFIRRPLCIDNMWLVIVIVEDTEFFNPFYNREMYSATHC